MVVFFQGCNIFADFFDDTCSFVSEDSGKESFGVFA